MKKHASWGNEMGSVYCGVRRYGSMYRGVTSWSVCIKG